MSEQEQQERKMWYVGDVAWGTATMVYEGNDDPHKGKFVCDCDPFMFDNETKLAGDGNRQHLAQQIADDHNRIGGLEAKIAGLEWEKQHLLGVLEIVREEEDKQCAELERTRAALAEARFIADKKHDALMRWTEANKDRVVEVDNYRLALEALVGNVDELMECGPFYASDFSAFHWACCEGGEDFHMPRCPYTAARNALEQAKAALSATVQQEEGKEDE